ncbi:MAG: type II toxin-antitoxin system prevent-host-death family antitoxin [Spirochaetaceae bacterium]|nr:type II toxin-antitoxin system prevent-host-death family antitoxin [Spirochaetaceae bacterium]
MNHLEIGAFEAKTHFSQLLKEVEQGSIIHVTRRGKPVAVISPEGSENHQTSINALDRIAARRLNIQTRENLTTGQILNLRDYGRK